MSQRAPSPTPSMSGARGSGKAKPEPEKIPTVKEMVDALNGVHERLIQVEKENALLKERVQAKKTEVNKPDVFEGDRKQLETFIIQCRMYFEANPGKFGNDVDKIKYASTFLRKGAQDWFSPHIRSFLDDPEEEQEEFTQQIFHSWTNFCIGIRTVYGDIDEKRTAARKLRELTQTGSVADYASKFQQLAFRTDWNDEAKTNEFYTGLKDHVKDDIARGVRPEELHDMIKQATIIDNRHHERQLEKKTGKKGTLFFGPYNKKSSKPGYSSKYYGAMPMELDSIQRSPAKLHQANIRHNSRKHAKAWGLNKPKGERTTQCFNCHQAGHWARDCKQPRKDRRQVNEIVATPADWSKNPEVTKEHKSLNWTFCYDDNCMVHESEKDGANYYPRKRSVNMIRRVPRKEPTSEVDYPEVRALSINKEATQEKETTQGESSRPKGPGPWKTIEPDETILTSEELQESEEESEAEDDIETRIDTRISNALSWLDRKALERHTEVMNYLARLMIDLGIYGRRPVEPTGLPQFREARGQYGIHLEEIIPKGSKFSQDGTCVTPQGLVIHSDLRDRLRELRVMIEDADPVQHPGRKGDYAKLDPKKFSYEDPMEPMSKN